MKCVRLMYNIVMQQSTCGESSSCIWVSFEPLLSFVGDSLFDGEGLFDPLSFEPVDGDRSFRLREPELDLSRLEKNTLLT